MKKSINKILRIFALVAVMLSVLLIISEPINGIDTLFILTKIAAFVAVYGSYKFYLFLLTPEEREKLENERP